VSLILGKSDYSPLFPVGPRIYVKPRNKIGGWSAGCRARDLRDRSHARYSI